MEIKKSQLVLEWNLDDASQDGYLHTRSFPLSLGDGKIFADIKEKKKPIIILVGDVDAIIAISREKYPGEVNSIVKGSKRNELLMKVIDKNQYLTDKKIIGFSYLYRKILNVIKDSDRKKIEVRKGVKIQLYSTENKNTFKLVSLDDGLNRWRNYREGDYISREKFESFEKNKIKASRQLSFKSLNNKIKEKRILNNKVKVYTEQFVRNPDVVAFALKRSEGFCELCKQNAPFEKENGDFYLEVHHLIPLSMQGEDTPLNVAALCPNCHRSLHYAKSRKRETKKLIEKIKSKTDMIL